jgi:hypothetical protein
MCVGARISSYSAVAWGYVRLLGDLQTPHRALGLDIIGDGLCKLRFTGTYACLMAGRSIDETEAWVLWCGLRSMAGSSLSPRGTLQMCILSYGKIHEAGHQARIRIRIG